MPSVLKRIDQYLGPWSDSPYPATLATAGVIVFAVILAVVAVTTAHILNWWEASIIAGTIVIVASALVWSCVEVRRIFK